MTTPEQAAPLKRYGHLKFSDGRECSSLFGERADGNYYLASDVDALLADAMRYRWLRDRWFIAGEQFPDELHEGAPSSAHFDEAIDAAMKDKP